MGDVTIALPDVGGVGPSPTVPLRPAGEPPRRVAPRRLHPQAPEGRGRDPRLVSETGRREELDGSTSWCGSDLGHRLSQGQLPPPNLRGGGPAYQLAGSQPAAALGP